jgi:integrase
MSKRLTAIQVAQIKPAKERVEIADGTTGLRLVVQPSGKKSWCVRYRHKGRTRKLTVDGFPPLADARKLAASALAAVADGGDPAGEKRVKRRQTELAAAMAKTDTVDAMFHDYLVKRVRKRSGAPIRESSRIEVARRLGFKRSPDGSDWVANGGGVLAHWHGREAASIRRRDVLDLLDKLLERGPVLANHTLSTLKSVFRWAARRDLLERSPCDGVDPPAAETARERVLDDRELAALWHAADGAGYPFGHMTKLLVLTGCRRNEVRNATWAEIDLDRREWLIPGDRVKNGHPHLVPLSDAAMAVLASVPRIQGSQFVFTSTGGTPIGSLGKPKRALAAAMAVELGVTPSNWRLHDIRRTVVTGLQKLGFPLEVTEAVINHKGGTIAGVAGVYARHSYADEKRRALDAWASHVTEIATGTPAASNVVALR